MPYGRRCSALVARLALLSVLAVLAGCAGDSSDAESPAQPRARDDDSFDALQSDLLRRAEAPDRGAQWFHVVEELLPNTVYAVQDEPPAPLTDCVVSGEVLAVERGSGNRAKKPDTWVDTGFDDPRARTRTVLVSLAVEHELGGVGCDAVSGTSSTVQFGLLTGPELSVDDAADGLRAMDTVVVFLARSSAIADDPSLYSVVLNGGMIADVNELDGSLTLPFVSADRARTLLATSTSLDDLEAAGRTGGSTIAIHLEGDRLVR